MEQALEGPRGTHLTYYDSSLRPMPEVEEFRTLWAYRSLVWELIIRDIKVRYKRSVLGVAWTMLSPLLNMVVLTLVFSSLLKQQIRNYPGYFMIGSMYWSFFSTGTSLAASQTYSSNDFSRKVFLPRSAFVVSSAGVALVNLVLSIIPLILILKITGFHFHLTMAFAPVALLMAAAFTLGVGFIIFTLASRFADIREMYLILIQTWFFVTPIVYAPSIVPARYRLILWLNPHYYLIQTFRTPIYDGLLPYRWVTGLAALISISTLLLGWVFFCRRIDEYSFKG